MSNNPGVSTNLASALSYLFIPAVVFMVLQPYKDDKTVRRHAFHGIVIWVAMFVAGVVLGTLTWGLAMAGLGVVLVPLTLVVYPLLPLASLVLTVMLMLKAWQGDILRLPVLTEMAEKYSAQ